ncbi:phosphoglycerate dehydrogenase [Terrisporobacter mayombei]|nr:phosphoglycerate dehydrogenase [Terrisporobacter mayombei]MCC3869089.1 phosphoglycerate dehydrogenase [Terrisporobacter mayombei]
MKALFTLKFSEEEFNRIRDLGYDVIFNSEGSKSTLDKMTDEELESIDVLVTYNSFEKLDISKMKNLKYIQLGSTGFDQVPIDKVMNRNIILCNNKGGYSIPIAEWIVSMILQIYKNTKEFYNKQYKRQWIFDYSVSEVYGKRIGFLGTGTIASESAKRLKAFGVEIWGCNTDGRSIKYFDKCFSTEDMDEVFKNCDIVISTIPSTKQTYKLINKSKFNLMKEGSSFINVGRGKIVDEDDLIEYAHKFRCIALDVFQEEPLCENSKLWDLDNIMITPHNSWVSEQDSLRSFNLFYNNLRKVISNKELENKVEIEKGY